MIKFFGKSDDSIRRAYLVDNNNNKVSKCLAVIGTIDDFIQKGLISVVSWGDSVESNYLVLSAAGQQIGEYETIQDAAHAVRELFDKNN